MLALAGCASLIKPSFRSRSINGKLCFIIVIKRKLQVQDSARESQRGVLMYHSKCSSIFCVDVGCR